MSPMDAEKVVKSLRKNGDSFILTTNQIRKFLAGVNGIHNRILAHQAAGEIKGDQLPSNIVDEIKYLKIKLIYQCGRNEKKNKEDNPIRDFMVKANIEETMDSIGNSKKKFQEFNRYIEGIVAYHRYQGGK